MLVGAQFVRTTGEGTDDRLVRGHGGSRGVVGVEIGVGRLPVDGGAGVISLYSSVESNNGAKLIAMHYHALSCIIQINYGFH